MMDRKVDCGVRICTVSDNVFSQRIRDLASEVRLWNASMLDMRFVSGVLVNLPLS
jgi:hypothetical protein